MSEQLILLGDLKKNRGSVILCKALKNKQASSPTTWEVSGKVFLSSQKDRCKAKEFQKWCSKFEGSQMVKMAKSQGVGRGSEWSQSLS